MATEQFTVEEEIRFRLRLLKSELDKLAKEVRKSTPATESLQTLKKKFQELELACADVISCNEDLRQQLDEQKRRMTSIEKDVEKLKERIDEQERAYSRHTAEVQEQINALGQVISSQVRP